MKKSEQRADQGVESVESTIKLNKKVLNEFENLKKGQKVAFHFTFRIWKRSKKPYQFLICSFTAFLSYLSLFSLCFSFSMQTVRPLSLSLSFFLSFFHSLSFSHHTISSRLCLTYTAEWRTSVKNLALLEATCPLLLL